MSGGLRVCLVCGHGIPADAGRCPYDGGPLGPVDPLLGALMADNYQIEARIGMGGMSAVYRAVQLDLERNVALKVVSSTALENPDTARRFRQEAEIIAQLHHPSTVRLLDYGQLSDGRPFLVTEFLVGQTLGGLTENGPVPWRRVLQLMRQVCGSLAEAHAKGIVHRDLKPDNIFVVEVNGEDLAKVLDFGIAKLGPSSDTLTGHVFGTPTYMSPEQAAARPSTGRSDLYSLGAIAYRCLSGRPPFVSEQPMALLLKHIHEPPPPLLQVAGVPLDIPVEVEQLVMSLLQKAPERRPTSAGLVQAYLDDILGSSDGWTPSGSWTDTPHTDFEPPVIQPSVQHLDDPRLTADAHRSYLKPPPSRNLAVPISLILIALLLGGAAALWAVMTAEPVRLQEHQIIELPVSAAPSPAPPLRPQREDIRNEADQPPPPKADRPVREPKERAVRSPRRPPPRKPARPARRKQSEGQNGASPPPQESELPPGFLDFDIDPDASPSEPDSK